MTWQTGLIFGLTVLARGGAIIAFLAGLLAVITATFSVYKRFSIQGKDARIAGAILMAILPIFLLLWLGLTYLPVFMNASAVIQKVTQESVGLVVVVAGVILAIAYGARKQAPAVPTAPPVVVPTATTAVKRRKSTAAKAGSGKAAITVKPESKRKRNAETGSSPQIIRWVFLVLILTVVALLVGAIIAGIRKNTALAHAEQNATKLQWPTEPAMTIDPTKNYFATLDTTKGSIRIQLFADKAPHTVNNFVFLARAGFFEGTTFHRVLQDFMAQGGDPTGTGYGGPGYTFADEIVPDLTFADAGMVAMANSGKDTNGSQFFITFTPQLSLNGGYTIFGKVVDGMSVVLSLTIRDPQQSPDFLGDVIQSVTIEETTSAMADVVSYAAQQASPEPRFGRPLAALAIDRRADLFRSPPAMSIDQSHSYQATLTTTKGKIVVDLFNADAPRSVNNFIVLADLGYWDHYPVSRLQQGKWILSGAPAEANGKDIGYALPSEIKRANEAGAFGYWSRPDGGGSSGSAIYILLQDNKSMDSDFTVFGKVTEGLDVASTLTLADSIETIEIAEK